MRLPAKKDRNLLIIALILASITYHYVNTSVRKDAERYNDPSYKLIKLTAKTVPVKIRFASSPPEGYRLLSERVKINPAKITLIGPEALLEETSSVETEILDISESTKKVLKAIPLASVAGIQLSGEPYEVEVSVPIEKLESN